MKVQQVIVIKRPRHLSNKFFIAQGIHSHHALFRRHHSLDCALAKQP